MRIAVVGSTGFVGSAVVRALEGSGQSVRRVKAPRFSPESGGAGDAERRRLSAELTGADVIVNCAGNPDASSGDLRALLVANADVPAMIAEVATAVSVTRFVHVSSAVVQGRREPLDDSLTYEPFSAYAKSKIEGERRVLAAAGDRAVVYRPGSVHAPGRGVTTGIARVARSPFSSVAGRKPRPVPQAYLENVASAIAFLATTTATPPQVVHHPSEGVTNHSLLKDFGNRDPKVIPLPLARLVVTVMRTAGIVVPRLRANVRRIEMIWFGQAQAPSWLEGAGWHPPHGREVWREMGAAFRSESHVNAS